MKRILGALVVWSVACALHALPGALAEDTRDQGIERTLERLEHPLLGERERALRDLVDGLPATRDRVIEVLPDAPWVVKLQLAHVLATDASSEAVEALLGLFRTIDEVQASAIGMRIVKDEIASAKILDRFRANTSLLDGKGTAKDRLRGLYELLRRAEIESRFLDHKSATGGTGYYRGQYDGLKSDRKLALRVVAGIAMDEAFPVPGRYHTGAYEFLRPRAIDWWEVRDMAMNAVAELGTPGDMRTVIRLEAYALRMQRECQTFSQTIMDGSWGADQTDQERQEELMDLVGRWGDVVAALFAIDPSDASRTRVLDFLERLGAYDQHVRFHWWPEQQRAATFIRVGWYEEAISEYRWLLRGSRTSRATHYYNLACAYASWSLDPGERLAEDLRSTALFNLSQSVIAGWTDIGWMEQDRDLDPIRDTDEFRNLVKQIEADLGVEPPPDDDK